MQELTELKNTIARIEGRMTRLSSLCAPVPYEDLDDDLFQASTTISEIDRKVTATLHEVELAALSAL
jgi:hypothetical protein